MTSTLSCKCLIIGAGMSGLCMAIQLRRAGIGPVVLVERSQDVGGTWLDNHYPNSGCDIPSFLYSYSFAPKHDWTQKYARQPEILQYFRDCADRFGVRENIRFGESVESAEYIPESSLWSVKLSGGCQVTTQFLISAVGQLNEPRIPDFPGLSEFQGPSWHSARWKQDVALQGRRVAVIGNGASTIQFLRQVTESAAHVCLFQRSPSWIHPLHNFRFPRSVTWCFSRLPLASKLYRLWTFAACEYRIIAMKNSSLAQVIYRRWLRQQMVKRLSDDMQKKMIPDYPPGCKRILLSNDFLETIQRDNVTVVTEAIDRFEADAVVAGGKRYPADTTIFGTGFKSTDFLRTIRITGLDGISLQEAWRDQPRTLLGLATPGFPNLFFLYGPNTNLGHNSIIYMVESQVRYIIRCLQQAQVQGKTVIHVREDAVRRCQDQLRSRLKKSVWAADCSNWYKTADGTISTNWSGAAMAYRWQTRSPRLADLEYS